ncbi:unnamed protein product, partial [Schistosoma turkestanicum]
MVLLKGFLFVSNTICLLCSLVLIGTGVYVHVKCSSYGEHLHNLWQTAAFAAIAIGVIVLMVSFLGCCGAIKENVGMLHLYSFLLIILLVAELAAAAVAFVFRSKIDDELNKLMTGALDNPTKEIMAFMDLVQSSFQCCGVKGPEDYQEEKPMSCKNGDETYTEGCLPIFGTFLKRNLLIV